MSDKEAEDPEKARYLRRRHNADGFDEEEQEQERNFKENPMDAINKASKHRTQKSLQKQVEYFGNAIEPFHMREEQNMGDIDEDGFFVFKRRKGVRDAWLESIDQNEEAEAADKLVKKIKTETRFKSVYEAQDKINENDEESEEEQQREEQEEQSEEKEEGLKVNELIELVVSLIPSGSSANKQMKKLKGKKEMQQYNKILFICNQYIEKTGEHDILTKKKEQLEEMLQNQKKESESPQLDWDKDSEQNEEKAQKEEEDDEDNIF